LTLGGTALGAEGAWVAIYRNGDESVAFERASARDGQLNLLSVAPKSKVNGIVVSWNIRSEFHQFDCAGRSYRILTKKLHDQTGKVTSDETAVVVSMNQAFKDRTHAADSEALQKALAFVCQKSEPAPAKPFASMGEALAWMAN
jgi:hypothetical protein